MMRSVQKDRHSLSRFGVWLRCHKRIPGFDLEEPLGDCVSPGGSDIWIELEHGGKGLVGALPTLLVVCLPTLM